MTESMLTLHRYMVNEIINKLDDELSKLDVKFLVCREPKPSEKMTVKAYYDIDILYKFDGSSDKMRFHFQFDERHSECGVFYVSSYQFKNIVEQNKYPRETIKQTFNRTHRSYGIGDPGFPENAIKLVAETITSQRDDFKFYLEKYNSNK